MKKLKKIIVASLSLMMCVVAVGCGGNSKDAAKVIDVDTVRANLNESGLLKLDYVDSSAKEHYIFEENLDKIKNGFVSQAMINVKLQDVIVVEGNSEADAKALMSNIEEYKENSLRLFADGYGGEGNAEAVANSKLVQEGNVVYFIAAEEVDAIEKIILGE